MVDINSYAIIWLLCVWFGAWLGEVGASHIQTGTKSTNRALYLSTRHSIGYSVTVAPHLPAHRFFHGLLYLVIWWESGIDDKQNGINEVRDRNHKIARVKIKINTESKSMHSQNWTQWHYDRRDHTDWMRVPFLLAHWQGVLIGGGRPWWCCREGIRGGRRVYI